MDKKQGMLGNLEAGACFYCAAGHKVPGWGPGLPKPGRQYRMCLGYRRNTGPSPCVCGCPKEVEFAPMRGYSTRGLWKGGI